MKFTYCLIETPMGVAGAWFVHSLLARFWLPGLSKDKLLKSIHTWSPSAAAKVCPRFEKKVARYFEGQDIVFDERISLVGIGRFHASVYENLRKVGRGKTVTYGELAAMSGNPRAARAVGSAMAKNPIPLIIPCHRVVRGDGSLGQFSGPGGKEQKRRMLLMETTSI